MATRKGPRPGGRSARVQAAVHQAVRELHQECGREGLTVPAIAARAGVTPSTIYRRWTDLPQLLSDVAVENLRPDSVPPDSGSFRTDMEAWVAQYLDEMSSDVGRRMMRDILASPARGNADYCGRCVLDQFDILRARAEARGEHPPPSEELMDQVVAPVIYRILFSSETPGFAFAQGLLHRALRENAPA